jgi:hypothetical protein
MSTRTKAKRLGIILFILAIAGGAFGYKIASKRGALVYCTNMCCEPGVNQVINRTLTTRGDVLTCCTAVKNQPACATYTTVKA